MTCPRHGRVGTREVGIHRWRRWSAPRNAAGLRSVRLLERYTGIHDGGGLDRGAPRGCEPGGPRLDREPHLGHLVELSSPVGGLEPATDFPLGQSVRDAAAGSQKAGGHAHPRRLACPEPPRLRSRVASTQRSPVSEDPVPGAEAAYTMCWLLDSGSST
jgi:hypothetical protein